MCIRKAFCAARLGCMDCHPLRSLRNPLFLCDPESIFVQPNIQLDCHPFTILGDHLVCVIKLPCAAKILSGLSPAS